MNQIQQHLSTLGSRELLRLRDEIVAEIGRRQEASPAVPSVEELQVMEQSDEAPCRPRHSPLQARVALAGRDRPRRAS